MLRVADRHREIAHLEPGVLPVEELVGEHKQHRLDALGIGFVDKRFLVRIVPPLLRRRQGKNVLVLIFAVCACRQPLVGHDERPAAGTLLVLVEGYAITTSREHGVPRIGVDVWVIRDLLAPAVGPVVCVVRVTEDWKVMICVLFCVFLYASCYFCMVIVCYLLCLYAILCISVYFVCLLFSCMPVCMLLNIFVCFFFG